MKTGYVLDPVYLKHTDPNHPEQAERLEAIQVRLKQAQLWPLLTKIQARPATPSEMRLAHSPAYLHELEAAVAQAQHGLHYLNPDTYINRHSYQAALMAVGGLIELCGAVVAGQVDNGFAFVRPPGHHATPDESMGFCLLANVAIAAKTLQTTGQAERVAIIDFDVHHGNGTQDVLYNDPTVYFSSTHQYPFYPGTGSMYETGGGKAKGTKVNLPLPPFVGDDGFEVLYEKILSPTLRRFKPDFIIISAGYDAHWADPLAHTALSLKGLARLSQTLVKLAEELCDGRIVFALEGGYHHQALAHGVANSVRALLGRTDFEDPLGPSGTQSPSLHNLLGDLQRIHNLY
jgi:acetoin utilization deacetylase AcuC-like enzyme